MEEGSYFFTFGAHGPGFCRKTHIVGSYICCLKAVVGLRERLTILFPPVEPDF